MERLNPSNVTAEIPQKALEQTIVNLPAQKESKKNKNPFVIRGHHLDVFIEVARGYMTPEDIASDDRNGREEDLKMTTKDASLTQEQIVYIRQERAYARDVIGKTKKEAEAYEHKSTELFHKFLQLPDEHPVRIVVGQKDEICKTCTVGDHCSLKDQGRYNGGESVSSDGLPLGIFLYVAKKKNLQSQIEIRE